jgi:hypothetical protein
VQFRTFLPNHFMSLSLCLPADLRIAFCDCHLAANGRPWKREKSLANLRMYGNKLRAKGDDWSKRSCFVGCAKEDCSQGTDWILIVYWSGCLEPLCFGCSPESCGDWRK